VSLQKTTGRLQWKGNLFFNKVNNFIYGNVTGELLDEEGNPGDELRERIFEQANATIRGAEAEIAWNPHQLGWSSRVFADSSRGKLTGAGSLPLQAATRLGAEVGYRTALLRAGLSLVRAKPVDRLAAFEESATPGYTQLNANLSYVTRLGAHDVTWFLLGKNLLNEEIRVSTSVLKDISPLPGRNLVFGARTKF
jgi:iron complex outermembrane receptor protein